MKTFLRVLVIGAILIILVFLSIGIVRVVPKALSSLASATVSLGSIFGGSNTTSNNSGASGTNQAQTGTTGANQAQTNANGVNGTASQNGFIISSSTPSTGSTNTSTSTSLTDIITAKFGSYGQNNYVPTPGTNTSSYNYSTGAYSNTTNTSKTTSTGASGSNGSVQTSSASACASTGSSDLAVEVLSKGIIDKTTGQFIATNSFSTNDIVSVKFKVENRGACPTGTWNIRVQMPSSNTSDQLKVLNNNASIPSGAALVGQANFDSPVVGNTTFTVSVTDNSGRDTNLNDNTSSVALSVFDNTGGTGSTGGVVVIGDGRADLAVRILQVGTLSYNNVFIPQSNSSVFRTSDRLAVRFEVINLGKTSTGPWTFRAEMSGYPGQQYQNTQYENAIASGGKATYTIGFNNPQIGSNYITIYADNLNQINEFDENNNVGTANFYVSY